MFSWAGDLLLLSGSWWRYAVHRLSQLLSIILRISCFQVDPRGLSLLVVTACEVSLVQSSSGTLSRSQFALVSPGVNLRCCCFLCRPGIAFRRSLLQSSVTTFPP